MSFVVAERETLDQHFVNFESMHHLEGIEVPNNDVSLETHMSLLTRCNVFSTLGDFNDGDIVVMASEELLCSRDNMSDN